MNIFEKMRAYAIENKRNVIVYGTVCVITIILLISLIVWAASSAALDELFYVEAKVRLSEGMRREYLVNEKISENNISLELENGSVIAGEDCTIEVDMTSAGVKQVMVSWQDGNTVYNDDFQITVFGVRHISIEQYPSDYWIDVSGNPVLGSPDNALQPDDGETDAADSNGLVVWAELTGEPTEFSFPEEHPEWTTTIVLTPELYTLENKQTQEGYAFEVACGNVKQAFALINVGAQKHCLPLQSFDSIVTFTNVAEGNETLTLYIEQSERNFEDGDNEASMAKGTYVFTAANGGGYLYAFRYTLSGWNSNFLTASLNNWQITDCVDDSAWGGDMKVTVGGAVFRGARADWHLAVLDNRA